MVHRHTRRRAVEDTGWLVRDHGGAPGWAIVMTGAVVALVAMMAVFPPGPPDPAPVVPTVAVLELSDTGD